MTSPSNDYLYETDSYGLRVGVGAYVSALKDVPCYQLVNKVTGIVEGEGVTLPEALATMLGFSDALEATIKAYEDRDVEAPPTQSTPPEVTVH